MTRDGFYVCDNCETELYLADSYPFDNEFFGDQYNREGEHLCWECWTRTNSFEETLTLDNALKCGNRDNAITGGKFNDFWRSIYSREEIEELCRKDFEGLPAEQQKEIIREYAEYDPQNWAEKLECFE